MKVAYGLKTHSGWAALVVLAKTDDGFVVVDRRRVELVEEEWARQPYHAAEELDANAAAKLVKRGIDAAYRIATREVRAARSRRRLVACAWLWRRRGRVGPAQSQPSDPSRALLGFFSFGPVTGA